MVSPESKLLFTRASRWSCRPWGQGADFVVVPSVEGWTSVTLPKIRGYLHEGQTSP